MSEPGLTVYWQPGCTSCLALKRWLEREGLPYRSVNVREAPGAMAELAQLGAQSVPVLARGDAFTLAQDFNAVAAFVGRSVVHTRLPIAVLLDRLAALLAHGAQLMARLPDDQAEVPLPGRADRTLLDLGYHVAMIVEGLREAIAGGALTYAHFERRPHGDARRGPAVIAALEAQRLALLAFGGGNTLPVRVATYYGEQPLHGVLERSTWHVAQHVRQLAWALARAGDAGATVPEALLAGLPLPDDVWEREPDAGEA